MKGNVGVSRRVREVCTRADLKPEREERKEEEEKSGATALQLRQSS